MYLLYYVEISTFWEGSQESITSTYMLVVHHIITYYCVLSGQPKILGLCEISCLVLYGRFHS